MKIAIIIPCYNSEKMLEEVVKETSRYLDKLANCEYEFVLVNDCSKDATFECIKRLTRCFPNIKGIDLARNAGQHNALLAGLRVAEGDYFIGMDDDMQTHPSQIKKLVKRLEEGYDIVYGSYPSKKTTLFRKIGSWFNNITVAKLIGKPKEMKVSSFWIIRKFVRDEIITYNSSFTNLQGLFLRTSGKITNVPIEHFERKLGKSNYTIKKLFSLWSSFINYSFALLRVPLIIGMMLSVAAFIHIIVLIIMLIVKGDVNYLLNLIMILIEIIGGISLISLGMVSEYIGRLFMVETHAPQSVVREYIQSEENKSENCNYRK